LVLAALLTITLPAKSQVPTSFRPDAGTILNSYAPRADTLELPASTLPKPADDTRAGVASSTRVLVSSFELTGVSLLPEAEVQAQLADLIGKEVTLGDLRKGAARVTTLYRQQGFFLARAYVPAQDIKSGAIRIAVLEGQYDSVEANGSPRLGATQADKTLLAQGIGPDQPVEQRSLERSLILLEQRVGAPATAVLRPGANPGTSSLQIDVPDAPLVRGSLATDTFGNRYTGEERAIGSLHFNSPLGFGDAGELWTAWSTGARALFASYLAPIGHRGLTFGASYADYHYELCCEFNPLERTGDARVAGLQARYPLLLTQDALLNAGISLQRKSLVDNWAEGDLADRRATVVTVGLDGLSALGIGTLRYQWALTRGDLTVKGPQVFIAINAATIDTAGHFNKMWGQVELLHPVSDHSFVTLRLSGQASSRNLDSSEKFLLGGFNGIRAYPEGEAAGDEALLARVEWTRPLNFSAMSGRAALHVFIDAGTTWIVDDLRGGLADPGIPNHYSLAGAGLGFNWNVSHGLSLNTYVATKIGSNAGRSFNGNDADGRDSSTRGWFGLEWAF
jgi:hemolysin activation/secretion protein